MKHHHYCLRDLGKTYVRDAELATDAEVQDHLRSFEGPFKGDKPGGNYLTPAWRVYKRVWRQEAHRRGLS